MRIRLSRYTHFVHLQTTSISLETINKEILIKIYIQLAREVGGGNGQYDWYGWIKLKKYIGLHYKLHTEFDQID